MKKRSLFKRLLSGFVATAMALSICFSDKVFEDLFASAAEGDPSVTVKVMNDGNLEKYANHVSGTKYYVLGALVNKEDAGISVKKDNVDKIVAWDCKEIDLANKAEDTVTFETFYKKSKNYASEFDRDQDPEPYDKNKYAFIYRVFQYRVEGNNGVNPYATKGVEPTNLIAPQGQRPAGWNYQAYNEISSDQFDGYVWEPATVSGDSYTSILDKRNPELYVTVNFGKPTTVTADDHVYAVVEVDHVGAPAKTIGYAPLVTDGEGKMTATVAIQAGEKQDWYKENGDHSTEKFTGNEPNYKVRLFQAEKATGIKDILGGKATEYKVGDMVLGQEFLSTDKSKDEAEIAKPKYYAIATLGTVSDPDNYTYSEILGPARVFGITADRFEQINHMQTNFAANVYKQAEFRPDLSKPTGGSVYVGKLVTFDATDKTKYTEVDTPYIRFEKINQITEHPKGYGAKLFSPYGDKVDITEDGMGYVERHKMSADDIKNTVVGPAISHIQFMSDVLAKQEANYIPVKGGSAYSIDTTHYPENTTIYVDADSMLDDEGKLPILHMSLAKGQNIVFNFKNADKVKVDQFYIRTLVDGVWNVGPEPKPDGDFYAGHTGESQKWDSDFNNWMNEYVMRNVVFNFNKATDVEVGGTAGLFIVKNPNSETVMNGTTTGWMATAGYFQKNSGEWHFPYDDVGDYKEPVPADFVISKTSITNNKEIEGATIQIIDAERPQGDWDYMVELNKEQGVEAVIEGGKTIGITWTSSGTAKNIKLSNGNYTFRETGDEFTSKTDGKKYKVVTSETNFVVASGKVVKEPKDVTEDNGTIKYTKTNNTITISDAQAGGPVTYPVHVSKTEITGQKAVAGATLTVYKYDATKEGGIGEKVDDYETRAVDDSRGTFMLEAGKYVLVEKATVDGGAPSLNGKTYKVITTEFKFEVKEDGTVECTGAKASVDNFTADEKANGGLVLTKLADKNEPYFIMCDAANTTNITVDKQAVTGEAVIENAHLKIVDSNNVVKGELITTKTDKSFEVELEDGTYTLTETAAEGKEIVDAQGNKYEIIPSSVEFTIQNGQIVSATHTVDSKDKVDQNKGGVVREGTTFTICDAKKVVVPEKLKVKVDKTAVTGEAVIENAHLKIVDSNNVVKGELITTKTDKSFEVELEDGTYTLTETAAEGKDIVDAQGNKYEIIPSSVEFTIQNGQIVSATHTVDSKDKVDQNKGGVVYSGTTFTVCDAIKPKTVVTINKKDVTGKEELEGATLTLTKADGSAIPGLTNKSWESKKDVAWNVQLQEGDYILKESGTKVTDENGWEYDVLNSAVAFTIGEDGKITVTSNNSKTDFDNDNSSETGFAVAKNTGDCEATLTICDAIKPKTVVKINKKDVTGKEELEGATLTLTKADGSAIPGLTNNSWESKKDAAWNVQLQKGDYILKESGTKVTDENGWEYDVLNTEVAFTIGEDGKITVTSNNSKTDFDKDNSSETGFAVAKNTGTRDAELTICDAAKKTPVKFNKKDITGKEELEGAKLTVYKYDDTKTDKIGTEVKGKVSSKEADSVFELKLANGKYVLRESGDSVVDAAGNKYDIIETTLTFEVNNGTVTATGAKTTYESNATTGYFYKDGTTIEICDAKKVVVPEKLTVKVDKKAITGDAVIENAHLKIVDSNNVVKGELITTKTDKSFEVELEDGTYTLTETAAEGKDIVDAQGNKYEIIPSSVTFKIENGQIVSATNTVDSKDKVDQNKGGVVREGTTFTICDAKKVVVPEKLKVKVDKKAITGDAVIENAVLKIVDSNNTVVKEVVTSKTETGFEVELEDGTYTLTETAAEGKDIVDAQGNKYEIIPSSVEFTIQNGQIVSATHTVDSKDKVDQNKGGVVYSENTFTICDAKKSTPSDEDENPDDDSSKPSDDSSKPSGGDNDGDNDSNKGKKPSGGDNDGDNDSNKGKKPSGGDEDGDNTPNTGFAGSTFAAAALLAAVSVLAVMKKKDE